MRKNIIFIINLVVILGFLSCEKMNKLHDVYLKEGEIDYVGRMDSVKAYAGNERIKFEYWITDPRATKLHIKWFEEDEIVKTISIPAHKASEMQEYILGEDEPLAEKNYTFTFVTESESGVKSINYEVLGNVYGKRYSNDLTDRNVAKLNYDDGEFKITFGSVINEENIGVKVHYFNMDGESNFVFLDSEELLGEVVIEDINIFKGVKYQTLYLPEENAIDTFYTDLTPMEIVLNVALFKNVSVSDQLNDKLGGENAVDGIVGTNVSRWVSSKDVGDHWLVVDLGQIYLIDRIKIFDDTPSKNFKLQVVDINGDWVDVANVTNNTNKEYEKSFSAISTSKVRYFVTTTEYNELIRLFEIEIYTTI